MPLFQAKRKHPIEGTEETVFVDAPDRTAAIAALRAHGWASAEWLDTVPPGSDIPDDAAVLRAGASSRGRARRPMVRVAESSLIQRPIGTIALGVVLGWLIITVIRFVLALIAGLVGLTFPGGG